MVMGNNTTNKNQLKNFYVVLHIMLEKPKFSISCWNLGSFFQVLINQFEKNWVTPGVSGSTMQTILSAIFQNKFLAFSI